MCIFCHFVGGTLFEDPAFDIRTLLAYLCMLEKKRSVCRSSHQLGVGMQITFLMKEGGNNNVAEVLKTLEKKSCDLWKQQHELSSSYDVELD